MQFVSAITWALQFQDYLPFPLDTKRNHLELPCIFYGMMRQIRTITWFERISPRLLQISVPAKLHRSIRRWDRRSRNDGKHLGHRGCQHIGIGRCRPDVGFPKRVLPQVIPDGQSQKPSFLMLHQWCSITASPQLLFVKCMSRCHQNNWGTNDNAVKNIEVAKENAGVYVSIILSVYVLGLLVLLLHHVKQKHGQVTLCDTW